MVQQPRSTRITHRATRIRAREAPNISTHATATHATPPTRPPPSRRRGLSRAHVSKSQRPTHRAALTHTQITRITMAICTHTRACARTHGPRRTLFRRRGPARARVSKSQQPTHRAALTRTPPMSPPEPPTVSRETHSSPGSLGSQSRPQRPDRRNNSDGGLRLCCSQRSTTTFRKNMHRKKGGHF